MVFQSGFEVLAGVGCGMAARHAATNKPNSQQIKNPEAAVGCWPLKKSWFYTRRTALFATAVTAGCALVLSLSIRLPRRHQLAAIAAFLLAAPQFTKALLHDKPPSCGSPASAVQPALPLPAGSCRRSRSRASCRRSRRQWCSGQATAGAATVATAASNCRAGWSAKKGT